MTKTEKETFVKDFKGVVASAQAVILAEFKGMKVAEAVELRRRIRKVNGKYQVAKNTLLEKALGDTPFKGLQPHLSGSTAVAVAIGDPVPLAKALVDFGKKCPPFKIKGAFVGDRLTSVEDLNVLAALPSREILLSQMVGVIKAPLLNLLSVLQGVPLKLVLVLKALEQKRNSQTS
ncbi:MAG: 50S ribosomal protein L10 [Nitrospirae bacterium]|nr:50S ribosomal protein L10 [Nitrospirota bacterium]